MPRGPALRSSESGIGFTRHDHREFGMNAMNTPASTPSGATGAGGSMTTAEIKSRLDAMFVSARPDGRRRGSGLRRLDRAARV
ncbi:hypothetical protein BTZ20_3047 [Rhodococcus sp. MTM3W5.2]|nr:hypothetical protein BTZ20_3047 [Rhodococcus sp. MTM3W5.2]